MLALLFVKLPYKKKGFNQKVRPKIKTFAQDFAKIWWILGNPQGLSPF